MKWNALRSLDMYARAEEHLTTQTLSGALVSLAGLSLMVILFVAELMHFLSPHTVHHLQVDDTRGEVLAIHLNLSFPALPCGLLSLDALDMSGKHEVDIDTTLYKTRMDSHGAAISSEKIDLDSDDGSHPPSPTEPDAHGHNHHHNFRAGGNADTVNKLKESLARGEGCNIAGYLEVERVAGNFHVSVHAQSFHVLEAVLQGDPTRLNVSHVIHSMAFGPEYPGIVNPLDGTDRILQEDVGTGTFKYFLKVVPTTYSSLRGPEIPTNQFSVTEYFLPTKGHDPQLPAVYFMYDLYPITVHIKESTRSFGHFLTRLCAVVGGVFAVSGMLDRTVHSIVQAFGKQA
mmetsp:Transcript_49667/g.94914  ORF Transcript_49667/g.94914 Transcript_49667/m.94914 type:complete len:344 (-) Transcript_49667:178-1209(-)